MFINYALVLLVGVAADSAFNIPQPGLKILSDAQVSRSGKNPAIRIAHSLPQDSPAFTFCLRTNPTPLAVRSKERAPKADDLPLLIAARRNRPCAVAPTSLLRHPST